MTRTWRDIDGIAADLAERHPLLDPLSLGLPELRRMVVALPAFRDDPDAADGSVLEAIQAAWYDTLAE
jgi:FeS assembly protein IscX